MIIVIGFFLAMIIFLIYTHFEYGLDLESCIFSLIMGCLGSALSLVIFLIAGCIFESLPAENKMVEELDRVELIALKDNFEMNGSAFLFSTVINEKLEYTYVYEEPGRGLTTASIDADEAYIQYIDESEQPYIETWLERPKNNFVNWLFCPGSVHHTIYLPYGSVIENIFEINLE